MNKPKPAGKDGGDPPASKPVSHIAPFPHFNPLSSTLRRERVPSIKLTNESPTKIDDFPHISIMLPAKTTDNIHKAQVNSLFSASTLSNRNMMLNQNYLLLKSQKMILERTFERATELFSQGHPTNLQENIKRSISTVLNSPYSTLFDEVSKQSEVLQNILQSTTIKSGSEEQRLLSTVLSVFIAILRMKTVICTTSTSDSPTRRGRRNSSVTNIGDIKISKDGVVEEGESIKMIQEINSSSENFICRICEEVVPLDLIEQHSALCIKAHQTLFNFYKCGEQLKSLKSAIATQFLSEQWPGEQQNALAVVFPVLYLYSFISLAIDIQNTDRDAMEQLDIVHQGMSNYEIPDEVKQLLPIFTTAKQLVIKKKQCCTDLVSASIAINATTRWHRYSSISGIHTHLSDFEIIGRLSSGAFARVYLSRKKKTGDLFAVKVIKRSNMNQKNQVRAVSTERDIMRRLHSPYVVNFYYSFIEKNNMYIVMEYIPGGDIFSLLQNVGALEESDCRTYTVQLVKALQFLRQNGIIHRDLKPDNVLITAKGSLKLADFGLSYFGVTGQHIKTEEKGPNNVVGTPDYMAPEIILSKNHTYTADYWSLGVMVFEMLVGIPPFHGTDEADIFRRILLGTACWDELTDVSEDAIDFIKKLLVVNPEQRLGSKNIDQIMKHKWFTGIDWDDVESMEPVFIPDTSRLDSYKEYFTDRYQFNQNDESDIIEDMQSAEQGVKKADDDDEVTQFPSISLEQLKDTNVEIAEKIRQQHRRASDGKVQKDNPMNLFKPNCLKPSSSQTGNVLISPLVPAKVASGDLSSPSGEPSD